MSSNLYAGRSDLATAATAAGASERVIMDQTGHRSVQTVRRYIRRGTQLRENSAGMVGAIAQEGGSSVGRSFS
jgi:integrase